MKNPKFVLFRSSDNNNYYFRLQAGNGEPILGSEGYTTKQGAQNGIQSVKRNAPYDSRYEDKTSRDGQYYFVLKAANGEIIGTSEMYTSATGRDNGKAAVKRVAPNAPTEDLT